MPDRLRRFPYYHQVEQSDCRVTCLRMVARYFGRRIPAKYLRDRVDLSRSGVSVRSLKECAEAIGMKGYGVKLSVDAIIKAPLPVILHWNRNHFAVLWKIDRKGRFHITDPSGGMLKYSRDEFCEHFCGDGDYGIALMLALPPIGSTPLNSRATTPGGGFSPPCAKVWPLTAAPTW